MIEVDLSIILAGLSIAASIVYYASVLRNANKTQQMQLETRQTQTFMQIWEQLNSEEYHRTFMELMYLEVEDNEEYLRKYDSSVNREHYSKRAHIWYSYNAIGELLRMGVIDASLIQRLLLDTQIIMMWEKWEPIIKATRLREKIPKMWGGFEYLYVEMKRLRDIEGLPSPELTQPP